jgi:hypothetical protein
MINILNVLFSAKDAKEVAKKFKDDNLNYQRSKIINRIKSASAMGENYIVLDDYYIKLLEDDYLFFENLGYKVQRETYTKFCDLSDKKEYYNLKYGHIYWD